MKKLNKWTINFSTLKLPIIFIVVFYSIAIWRYIDTGRIFYIFNFFYIGTSISIGVFLIGSAPSRYKNIGRRISQLLIGLYMLVYLGFIGHENMQIEGFFYYILGGVFAGATLHYVIAKVFGVSLFNRGWCSWACWTAMVLDFLPWKVSSGRKRKLGIIRLIHFAISLSLVLYIWFYLNKNNYKIKSDAELISLLIGNLFYYISSISMAYLFKDNRAFCKYLCPIPILQKILSRFSIIKIEINSSLCIDCGKCETNCPMDIKLLQYKNNGERVLSTECILCNTCANVCPLNAIDTTYKLDCSPFKEKLNYK